MTNSIIPTNILFIVTIQKYLISKDKLTDEFPVIINALNVFKHEENGKVTIHLEDLLATFIHIKNKGNWSALLPSPHEVSLALGLELSKSNYAAPDKVYGTDDLLVVLSPDEYDVKLAKILNIPEESMNTFSWGIVNPSK